MDWYCNSTPDAGLPVPNTDARHILVTRIGYGRVSTRDQHPEAQYDALLAAGCDQVFLDTASGKLARRPELDKVLLSAMLGILGAFAEFERVIIRERQVEGISLAKNAGKYKGRKRALTPAQVE